MPLSPITAARRGRPAAPAHAAPAADPLLTLAVLGLGVCSLVTLGAATQNLDPRRPALLRRPPGDLPGRRLRARCWSSAASTTPVLSRCKNGIYGALLLSILAVLGLGHAAAGSQRAINLPLFSFQASELGKVLLILALSAFVVERARQLRERDTTIRVMIAALVPAMFVIAQPDLGSGMVYMVIAYMLLFIAGTSWRHLAALAALVAVSGVFVLVAAPAAGHQRAQALPGGAADGLPAPLLQPAERRLPTAGVQDRDRLGAEDRPGRQQQPDLRTASSPRATPTSSSPPSASATASSARASCCCSTGC